MGIRVFLVDNHDGFRRALRALLDMQQGLTVIGEAANGREALVQIAQQLPDIAVLDMVMPEMNGIEATRQIRQHCPTVQVIILSMHASDQYAHRAVKAGARSYILKESAGVELVNAIRSVCADRSAMAETGGHGWH